MSSIAEKNPNPQGKGLVAVLQDLGGMKPVLHGRKTPSDFLRDYCLSSLVLAANFRIKPVIGKCYYLYWTQQGWSLSLVAPAEWVERMPGDFLAPCLLRADMTWFIDTSELDETSEASTMAQYFISSFFETLAEQKNLTTHLPFYVEHLPYYQRILGTALASSLQRSIPPEANDLKKLLRRLTDEREVECLLLKN